MKLAYHTRGNTSPQGKPRVYFTGHPADLEPYSRDIFVDILRTQNCAIYYDAEADAPFDQEELLRTLKDMQLVIIPVTSRFLYRPNRAREMELPFALECHIPVLPLMQEQGLDADFNEKCGDLQMLSKYDQGPAILSYPEKLQKHLDSVLVGDELATRIRAAFSAYIFLSYRKKDRKYALELMKLIHQNEFCQDVAIWYDEFLMPGENFTDSIQKAIDKSSLFALAVTPSMVNENNYVIEHEYPGACRAQKPILPVEMLPTDREALEACFPGIPRTVSARDGAALAGALCAGLQRPAVQTFSHEPERKYLVGLAYLNAVDVEADKNRAAALITSAAEDGLPEAMEKLADMYHSGDGVPRSYHTALRWRERLADRRRERFEESGTPEDALLWSLSQCSLGDCQEKLGDLSAAARTYRQMEERSRQFAARYGSMAAVSCRRFGYERLGSISMREDRLDEAESFFLRELEITGRLNGAAGFPDGEYQTAARYIAPRGNPAGCYIRLGQVCQARGQMDKAREYLLKSLEIFRRLYEEDANVGTRKGLADAYRSLGIFSKDASLLDEAREYLLKSLELSRQLYEETRTTQARLDLSGIYNDLGRVSAFGLKYGEARENILKALEFSKQLHEEAGTVETQRLLFVQYNNLGVACASEGNLDGGEQYYLRGLEFAERILEETGTVQAHKDLARILLNLGECCYMAGRLQNAKKSMLRGLPLLKQLYAETGTIEVQGWLLMFHYRLGQICEEEGRTDEAKAYYLEGIGLNEREDERGKQTRESVSNIMIREVHAVFYNALGSRLAEEDRQEEAEKHYLQSMELLRQLTEEIVDMNPPAPFHDLCIVYFGLSRVTRDKAKAKEYCLRGVNMSEQLCEKTGSAACWQGLSTGCRTLAALLAEEGDARQAVETYERALRISEKICGTMGLDRECQDGLAESAFHIGLLACWDAALQKAMLTQAHDVWTRLSRQYPEAPKYARQRDKAQAELEKLC